MKPMKQLPALLSVTALLFTTAGCREKKEPSPVVQLPAAPAMPKVNGNAAATDSAPATPAGTVSAEPVAPELAPIQQGIEAFTARNNRLPYNVDELVEQKIIPKPPALPAGKIYFIDHASGRIRIGNGP